MTNFIHVVGARPNFMKLAPLYNKIAVSSYTQKIIHTGQHYDAQMSDIFFEQLKIPQPDYHLGIGSATQTEQTAKAMIAIEQVLLNDKPQAVIVYGDVNSTLAASLVCSKLLIPIVHVEAGLRSGDRTMPEEINRIITDRISTLLLTPSEDANKNLIDEGIPANQIYFVGNIMIDTLVESLKIINNHLIFTEKAQKVINSINGESYILSTVHRPSNVDNSQALKKLFSVFFEIASDKHIILPLHPRTKKQLEDLHILQDVPEKFHIIQPMGYFDFIHLQKNAFCVLTDSGGIQEETSYLNVPCLTLRANTERPITIELGSNELIGNDYNLLFEKMKEIASGDYKKAQTIPFWDGKTSDRIVSVLQSYFG
ncbi:MAG: UDP-N-acetylglucosamine 2-epimerase (non-hydrolyzing) [Thermonemataceae bacterium]|nr:UDP-N-acetylglucosamine 2-epimerase (non-hydrolyzing) [Thermonemataceae bacterium]